MNYTNRENITYFYCYPIYTYTTSASYRTPRYRSSVTAKTPPPTSHSGPPVTPRRSGDRTVVVLGGVECPEMGVCSVISVCHVAPLWYGCFEGCLG